MVEQHQIGTISTGIRELMYPTTITYVNRSDGKVTFIYGDASMMTSEVTIDGYTVNDMVLTKDTVFFCGVKNKPKLAMLGFFNIQDAFFNMGPINVQEGLLSSDDVLISKLTRLETYMDSRGKRHMFCVGNDANTLPCLVDKTDFATGAYQVGTAPYNTETFTDVKIARDGDGNDYLVTAGYE